MTDPLSVPAGLVATPAIPRLDESLEPDLFFDGHRFLRFLIGRYNMFDVATYSLSKSSIAPLMNVSRLIYGIKQRGCNWCGCKERRLILNNHIKLFICYQVNPETPEVNYDVYLGSQNLTHGTNLNIMYRVQNGKHAIALFNFFNDLWKLGH